MPQIKEGVIHNPIHYEKIMKIYVKNLFVNFRQMIKKFVCIKRL
jgi:hypothetical protein